MKGHVFTHVKAQIVYVEARIVKYFLYFRRRNIKSSCYAALIC
jgi:hypothetical protein